MKRNEEGKDINKEVLNNIEHLIKNSLHVIFIQYGFVMYNDNVTIMKQEVITPIYDSMIPVDCFQNKSI